MKILVISSSLNPESYSLKCCKAVTKNIHKISDHDVSLVNLQEYNIGHVYTQKTQEMEELSALCEEADAFIFGFPIYNYNVSDVFASFASGILPKKPFTPYGLILAGGGHLSFLVTSSAHQMLMTHNQMIPFPKFLYTTKNDWQEDGNAVEKFDERISDFCTDFVTVSQKLVADTQ